MDYSLSTCFSVVGVLDEDCKRYLIIAPSARHFDNSHLYIHLDVGHFLPVRIE